jgi:hypothetical protein
LGLLPLMLHFHNRKRLMRGFHTGNSLLSSFCA